MRPDFWEAWVDWHLNDGFQIIHSERCYRHKRSPDGAYIKLGYHVDDNLCVGVGWEFYQQYQSRLTTKFDVTEGPLEEHLGVLYKFDMAKGVCHMSQRVHIVKFLKEFRMHDCDSARWRGRSRVWTIVRRCPLSGGIWRALLATVCG